ncbi:MAG: urate hydroxylase PuuD [Acidimicrobiia bacterium]
MTLAADLFSRFGLEEVWRWLHVVVGIAWIGLLYYFNLVQVPAFADLDPAARNQSIDKLASRALWWFRWAAAATLLMGVLILGTQENLESTQVGETVETGFSPDYWGTTPGTTILTGILLAVTMFLNVWLIIWPNQKKVIANARNVLAGGEADPNAAAAGRKALLASRTNVLFSFTMVWFMVTTSASEKLGYDSADGILVYWIVVLIIWAVLEAYGTGMIGGTAAGGHRVWEETVPNILISGAVLWIVFLIIWQIFLKA